MQPLSKDPSASFPLDGIDLDTVSDEQLISISRISPVLYRFWSTTIVRLSVNLILKFGVGMQMSEIEAMKCALSRTTVPTPKLHRYFFAQSETSASSQCGYIVMDYIEGNTLADIWDTLDQEKRKHIFSQIASIVAQLRTVHFDQPGPLGGGSCKGFWFTEYTAGPFNNKEEFNDWFTHKLEISQLFGWARKELPPFNYNSFVLVHQDLIPQNLMLDSDGKVWIIDWGNAGAYPALFEAARVSGSFMFEEYSALLLSHIYDDAAERDHLMGVLSALVSAGCR
ncbi:MAG: hypothetical protein Q9157_007185 [Trypethelium eluteriae]